MSHLSTSRTVRLLASTALILSTTACTDMEAGINSAYNDVFGDEQPTRSASVKSAAAAPYQDVKAEETQPVELAGMTDSTLEITSEGENAAETSASAPISQPTPVADAESFALLTIRFNQPHVYYDDALAQAVKAAETAKQNVNYDVLSNMPNLASLTSEQQDKLSKRGQANLRNVVLKMQQMGIPAERIRVANQTLTLRSQEIQVFVR